MSRKHNSLSKFNAQKMMKLWTLVFVFCFNIVGAQTILKVDTFSKSSLKEVYSLFFKENDSNTYYKINHYSKTWKPQLFMNCDITDSIMDLDTLKFIEELLNFENDKRLCAVPLRNYGINTRYSYSKEIGDYITLEEEALFLIHRLLLPKPISYSPYPFLITTFANKLKMTREEKIKLAYRFYKKWFKKIKKIGLYRVQNQRLDPLKGSTIRWCP